jgi:hypothetical protein
MGGGREEERMGEERRGYRRVGAEGELLMAA